MIKEDDITPFAREHPRFARVSAAILILFWPIIIVITGILTVLSDQSMRQLFVDLFDIMTDNVDRN